MEFHGACYVGKIPITRLKPGLINILLVLLSALNNVPLTWKWELFNLIDRSHFKGIALDNKE